jgi:TRAP-type C4-dicarboxylate transport system permease small subunit
MLARIKAIIDRLLETVVIALILGLTVVVVVAVIYRKLGASLSWYDEVASVLLAWVTYYGAALAALKRQHIGFDSLVLSAPPALRLVFVVIAEVCVFGFFILLAWTGWIVLQVLEGDTLVSLPQVSVQITQSVMPIGAVLFVICEALSLPDHWRRVRAGLPQEMPSDGGDEDGPAP